MYISGYHPLFTYYNTVIIFFPLFLSDDGQAVLFGEEETSGSMILRVGTLVFCLRFGEVYVIIYQLYPVVFVRFTVILIDCN
jgi:hypothetical protein